jgi:glycosyltransferase involved in cell wall biosynthesis
MRPTILHLHTPAAGIPVRMLPRSMFPPDMRIAFTVHGYKHKWTASPLDRLLQGLERVLSPRADITFFQSREDLDHAISRGFRGNLRYLGNGVDDEWFDIPPVERSGPLKLIYVGRLVREKGLLELIDAVSSVADVRLVIAGGELPSDRDGISDELNKRLGASETGQRVVLTGMLDRPELMRAMGDADVVILPSYREGVPQALMQGMASGRPAIATDIRGCRELVTSGENGILVPAKDAVALADAIREVRDLPASVFEQWARSARASMSETRRIEQVLDRLLTGYEELLPFRASR